MPLELEELQSLKDYINQFPTVPIFFSRQDFVNIKGKDPHGSFSILAGKVAWKGKLVANEADDLEALLIEFDAKKVKGWRELEEIFS